MTDGGARHPDLLRRFVATPYIFSRRDGSTRICVESNDLEVALVVRCSSAVQHQGRKDGGLFCKIIRDTAGPVDGDEMSVVSNGVLRVLNKGRGTILIHDSERSELLGFVSCNVKAQELAAALLPALFAYDAEQSADSAPFTNK